MPISIAIAGRGLDFWFTPEELALEPDEGLLRARLWAAKEAYAKALGQGFLLPPESLLIEAGGRARYRPPRGDSALPEGRISLGKGFWGSDKAVIIAVALLSS